MRNNFLEKSLKRYLKRKVKFTLSLIVSFFITGTVIFAEDTGVNQSPNTAFGNLQDGNIWDFNTYFQIFDENTIGVYDNGYILKTPWTSARGYNDEIVFNGNVQYTGTCTSGVIKPTMNGKSFVYDGVLKHINQVAGKDKVLITLYTNSTKEFRNNGMIFYTFDNSIPKTEIATNYVLYNDLNKEKFINNGYILGEGRLMGMGNSSNIAEMSNNGFIDLKAYEESYGMLFMTYKENTVNNMKNNGVIIGKAMTSSIATTDTIQDILNGMKAKGFANSYVNVQYLVNNGIITLVSEEINGYLAGINANSVNNIEKLENNGKISVKQISFDDKNSTISPKGIYLKYKKMIKKIICITMEL